MTKPLNLTKQEVEFLHRMVHSFNGGLTSSNEYKCKPFIEHLEDKLAAMKFPEEKKLNAAPKQKLKVS